MSPIDAIGWGRSTPPLATAYREEKFQPFRAIRLFSAIRRRGPRIEQVIDSSTAVSMARQSIKVSKALCDAYTPHLWSSVGTGAQVCSPVLAWSYVPNKTSGEPQVPAADKVEERRLISRLIPNNNIHAPLMFISWGPSSSSTNVCNYKGCIGWTWKVMPLSLCASTAPFLLAFRA